MANTKDWIGSSVSFESSRLIYSSCNFAIIRSLIR